MNGIYTRTEALLGEEKLNKLKNSRVLVVGLGGVGGYIAEALARAGVGALGLCDFDTVDPTNLNRQLIALGSTVGKLKTDVFKERIGDINPECSVELFSRRIGTEDQLAEDPSLMPIEDLEIRSWDYVADAIDDVRAKVKLIVLAREAGVPVISSMGTGNKVYPERFKIADISKTHTDPLAKAVRVKLRAEGIEKGVKVLFSDEEPIVKGAKPVPSISFMPPAAGLMIAGEIIRDITGLTDRKLDKKP